MNCEKLDMSEEIAFQLSGGERLTMACSKEMAERTGDDRVALVAVDAEAFLSACTFFKEGSMDEAARFVVAHCKLADDDPSSFTAKQGTCVNPECEKTAHRMQVNRVAFGGTSDDEWRIVLLVPTCLKYACSKYMYSVLRRETAIVTIKEGRERFCASVPVGILNTFYGDPCELTLWFKPKSLRHARVPDGRSPTIYLLKRATQSGCLLPTGLSDSEISERVPCVAWECDNCEKIVEKKKELRWSRNSVQTSATRVTVVRPVCPKSACWAAVEKQTRSIFDELTALQSEDGLL